MTKKLNKISYFYKITTGTKSITKCLTHSRRVFFKKIRTINWKEVDSKGYVVYLRINYGKFLDNYGKMSNFYNDGDYQDEGSFCLAFNAFLED